MYELRLHIGGDVEDTEESAALTSRLRDELLELEIGDVTRPSVAAPAGAKGDAVAWAELLVSLSGSLPALVGAIQSWRSRQRGATITIELAGDRLTLSDTAPAERNALVESWLARHGDG